MNSLHPNDPRMVNRDKTVQPRDEPWRSRRGKRHSASTKKATALVRKLKREGW